MVTAWIVYIGSIRTHSRIFVCRSAAINLNRKRHFFRCAANKEIWHMECIRRAVIFDVDFVINGGQDGHCMNCMWAIFTKRDK